MNFKEERVAVVRSILFASVAAFSLPIAGSAEVRSVPVVAPKPEYSAADLALLYGFNKQLERLAREGGKQEKQHETFLELWEQTAERIESPRLRQSAFDSLGSEYAKADRKAEAEAAYRKAIEVAGPRDSNYYHSVEALSRILTASGKSDGRIEAESLLEQALATVENPVRELSAVSELCRSSDCSLIHSAGARSAKAALAADLSPSERIEVTRQAASLFVLARFPDDATAAVRELLEAANRDDPAWEGLRPKAFRSAVSVAAEMGAGGFKEGAYDLTYWAGESFPDLADNPKFLSDLASSAKSAGLRRDAIAHRTRLVERFPDDDKTPEELSILARDHFDLGERDRAAELYRKVIGHPKSRPSQQGRARDDLAAIEPKAR